MVTLSPLASSEDGGRLEATGFEAMTLKSYEIPIKNMPSKDPNTSHYCITDGFMMIYDRKVSL